MIRSFNKWKPCISDKAIVDELAVIIGNVIVHDLASIWPCAMIRGGKNAVVIEKNVAIMDRAFIEAHKKVVVEEGSIISHAAILHGSKIGKNVLIGIGAIVLEVSIGDNSIVAAGSVVTKNFDKNSFIAGIPARRIREVKKEEKEKIKETLKEIRENAKYLSV
ncbi:MAG: gamma carbonic anhydrase family protein [Thermoplasmata archaeon]|nr:gamma carbonic anhydrase family protein [Thermoplasmata archaeon]